MSLIYDSPPDSDARRIVRCTACPFTRLTRLTIQKIHHQCPASRPISLARSEGCHCLHRGPELRREPCSTCKGTVQVKVFACAVLGECTLAKPLSGIATCETCEHYQRPTSHEAEVPQPPTAAPRQAETA